MLWQFRRWYCPGLSQMLPCVMGLPHGLDPTLHAWGLPTCQPLGGLRWWEELRGTLNKELIERCQISGLV